jgi:hypothetical protein
MAKLQIIKDALRTAGGLYIDLLREELEFQKHNASGRLSKGFFVRIHEKGGSLVMDVMNNVDYMWLVNNGSPAGVDLNIKNDYDTIKEWALKKGFVFDNQKHEKESVSTIISELRTRYFTRMGDKVAPRRYFFIEVAFDAAERMGLNDMIEEEIRKQIDLEIGQVGKSKAIQLTIG